MHSFRTETSETCQDAFTYFCIYKATFMVKFSFIISDESCKVTMQNSLYTSVKFYKITVTEHQTILQNLVVVHILLKTSPSSSCLHSLHMLSSGVWEKHEFIFRGKGTLAEAYMDTDCLGFHHNVTNICANFAYMLPHERWTFCTQTKGSKRNWNYCSVSVEWPLLLMGGIFFFFTWMPSSFLPFPFLNNNKF